MKIANYLEHKIIFETKISLKKVLLEKVNSIKKVRLSLFRKSFSTILLMIVFLGCSALQAQSRLEVLKGDTLHLKTDNTYSGNIQWQISKDSVFWDDITDASQPEFETIVNIFPSYFRVALTTDCEVTYSSVIEVQEKAAIADNTLLWSDPATWGSEGKPKAGDQVSIPMGKQVILDEDTPDLGGVSIMGKLEFARKDLSFTAKYIMLHGGVLEIGTAERPFENKAIITLNDTDTLNNMMGSMGTRGIVTMNGAILSLHGTSPKLAWTKLNRHAPDGATSLTLEEAVNWKAGDEIIIGPTDFYEAANGKSITQTIITSSVNGNLVSLTKPLEAHHWGRLQYAINSGMSLVNNNLVPIPTEPEEGWLFNQKNNNSRILDERAPVGNLTRNIVIQAPDDDAWRNEFFGVHIMIMPGTKAYFDGVEIKRGGQGGRTRRYPFHWHMMNYESYGTEIYDDISDQYIKNSTINQSHNRGIVVHGTNGALIQNNIVYDVKGHGIFTENAVERRNVFDHNLVLKIRNPEEGFAIKRHELNAFRRGSSGFWISNPDNTVTNNHAADCEGNGYWLAFPARPFGESSEVLYDDGEIMNPRRIAFGVFDNNTVHSCKKDGMHNDNPEIDEDGNTGGSPEGLKDYMSDLSGRDSKWPYETRRRFTIKDFKAWKNGGDGAWERATWINVINPISADNKGRCFAGSGFDGLILGALVVGRSLNYNMNGEVRKVVKPAFASYHHTFSLQGNIIINFPVTIGEESGSFSTIDYYLRGAEKGHYWSKGNVLINSHPGFKLTAYQGWKNSNGRIDEEKPHFNLAGALWDPQGFWGPKENYLVFNDPFYTYGQTTSTHPDFTAEETGGVSTEGPYFSLNNFSINDGTGVDEKQTFMAIEATRYDKSWNSVGTLEMIAASDAPSSLLLNMKDIEIHPTGRYYLNFPGKAPPNRINFKASNFIEKTDQVVFGVEFNGAIDAKVDIVQTFSERLYYPYVPVNSIDEVIASDGGTYWQDKENDKIWMKLEGGVTSNELDIFYWERWIYQRFGVLIH